MHEALYGFVIAQSLDSVVIGPSDSDQNKFGFAYRVFVRDPKIWIKGTQVSLLTFVHKTEMADTLYGFENYPERALFRDLLTADGIGPKAALSVMRIGSVNDVCQMIRMGKADSLRAAKGVNKGAENIILKLQKKYAQLGIQQENLI